MIQIQIFRFKSSERWGNFDSKAQMMVEDEAQDEFKSENLLEILLIMLLLNLINTKLISSIPTRGSLGGTCDNPPWFSLALDQKYSIALVLGFRFSFRRKTAALSRARNNFLFSVWLQYIFSFSLIFFCNFVSLLLFSVSNSFSGAEQVRSRVKKRD